MPKSTLSESDRQDIRRAMFGLRGPQAAAEAKALANFYDVHVARIYETTKADRPVRKKRSDCGKRKVDLLANEATKAVGTLVHCNNLSPELAIETVRENPQLFGEFPGISLGTTRRYLREHNISRRQTRTRREAYRPFRADFPTQIFQFDISGVKERFVDVKTRKIVKVDVLDVSRNHPNARPDRVGLWKFTLKDDNSGKKFVRFVGTVKPNTVHVIDFLREAFSLLGLPFNLYTDNDAIIVNKRMQRGARFIGEAFQASGGFQMIQHLPGRPQATGKVERAHQTVEEFEKLIGVKMEFGDVPTVEALNKFADWLCDRYNNRVHSTTGVAPNIAFRATTNPFRKIDAELFDAAFKARDLTLKVNQDVTITVDRVKYQLPRQDRFPFNELAATRQKVDVYWLDDEDSFAVVTPAGDEFTITKARATADAAFEHKELPETKAQQTSKQLKQYKRELRTKVRDLQKATSEPVLIVPGIDTEIPAVAPNEKILDFPQRVETGDTDRLHELTHNIANDAPQYSRKLDLFDALALLQSEDKAPSAPCEELTEIKAWLRTVFAGEEMIREADLRAAFDARSAAPMRQAFAIVR